MQHIANPLAREEQLQMLPLYPAEGVQSVI